MPSWIAVPVADFINKAWTPSTGTVHYILLDEGAATPDVSDFVSATTPNKNDRYTLTNGMPALCKEVTAVIYKVVCTGRDDSVDCSFALYDNTLPLPPTIPGFFKKCDIRTTANGDNWRSREFDKTGTPGGGGPVPTPRARFLPDIKVLMKSIAGGTGAPADRDQSPP